MGYNNGLEIGTYLKHPSAFNFENGYISLLKGPGLGVEVDEMIVRTRQKNDLQWKNPVYRLDDASITEW